VRRSFAAFHPAQSGARAARFEVRQFFASFALDEKRRRIAALQRRSLTMRYPLICLACLLLVLSALPPAPAAAALAESGVKLYERPLVIPTYEVGPPQKNPIFYSGRSYQGAKGPVYPYPLYDTLTDVRKDKTYKAVYLENKYVEYIILPELGGRIWAGRDKTNGYDFIYRQHVVKPALIGMIGAWISGGVEWNIPHHHRASTFLPVDYKLVENADGSKTCWVGEIELRHRMKWLVGMTLYPDRSYLEVTVKLINRTPLPHSILYFANIAVHANENYQVLFPPGTEFGTQHGKKEFVHWPIGQERYGGIDRRGVDLSWWKNHPTPVSIFAWNYEDDWFGGYDHGKRAGIVCFADHHAAPGKKFFEWGNGPEGRMWEKLLSDSDGPYLELMAGAWSDNQPDYSWIQPYETKTVKQYFYPVRDLGGVKAANLDAAVNLEVDEKKGVAKVAVNVTRGIPEARMVLMEGEGRSERVLLTKDIALTPGETFRFETKLPGREKAGELSLSLKELVKARTYIPNLESRGVAALFKKDSEYVLELKREIVGYRLAQKKNAPIPKPVEPPLVPNDIRTNEELYLAGLRLEQFHSPAMEPYPYYEEALKRDPGDYRVNIAVGILYLKRGMHAEAEQRFNAAIDRATKNHTKPKDGEAYYYLGVALKAQEKLEGAEKAFEKAAWSHAWSAAANYALAEVAWHRAFRKIMKSPTLTTRGQSASEALTFLDRAIVRNAGNPRAMTLRALVLRWSGRRGEAERAARAALEVDPLDYWAAVELMQLARGEPNAPTARADVLRLMHHSVPAHLELAAGYASCGSWDDAHDALLDPYQHASEHRAFLDCYRTYYSAQWGLAELQDDHPPPGGRDYSFPFQVEAIGVFRSSMKAHSKDARAPYYLGNLLFDLQPEKAIEAWEESRKRDDKFATVHRNLALAYAQVQRDIPKAVASMERAVACDPQDPKLYAELDVLYEAAGTDHQKRLAVLEKNHAVVARRDDARLREVRVDLLVGKYDRAIELLSKHHYHLWEGEKGLHDLWVDAQLLRGQQLIKANKAAEAAAHYRAALEYPENLETARPYRGEGRGPQVYYLLGTLHESQGNAAEVRKCFQQAVESLREGSELSYYQALAHRKLGQEAKAAELLDGLDAAAKKQLDAPADVDFFAKFGTRESENVRKAHAHYLLALSLLGKNKPAEAKQELQKALKLNVNHLWAKVTLENLEPERR
jgi:tetratricopeptide (TPR) repeat protein